MEDKYSYGETTYTVYAYIMHSLISIRKHRKTNWQTNRQYVAVKDKLGSLNTPDFKIYYIVSLSNIAEEQFSNADIHKRCTCQLCECSTSISRRPA